MRIGLTVGRHQTITVEIVVRRVVFVVVTAISIGAVLFVERLVNEVPDKSSLEFGILAHQVPIFLEAA